MKSSSERVPLSKAISRAFDELGASQIFICNGQSPKAKLASGQLVDIADPWSFDSIHDFVFEQLLNDNWSIVSITNDVYIIKPKTIKLPELNTQVLTQHLDELNRGLVIIGGPPMSGRTNTALALINALMSKRNLTVACYGNYFDCASINAAHQGSLAVSLDAVVNDCKEIDEKNSAFLNSLLIGHFDVYLCDLDLYGQEVPSEVLLAAQSRLVILTVTSDCSITSIIDALTEDEGAEMFRLILSRTLKAIVVQEKLPPLSGNQSVMATGSLWVTPMARVLISEDKAYRLTRLDDKIDILTYDDSLLQLVKGRLIAPEVALDHAQQREEMITALKV